MTTPRCDACEHPRYGIAQVSHDRWSAYLLGGDYDKGSYATPALAMERAAYLTGIAHASASVKALREALAAMLGAARIGNDGYCALGCAASASAEIHGNGCPIDLARAALKETEGM